jgi:hypothetical protein
MTCFSLAVALFNDRGSSGHMNSNKVKVKNKTEKQVGEKENDHHAYE